MKEELRLRVLSAVVLAVSFLFVIFFEGFARLPLFLFVLFFGILSLLEFYRLSNFNNLRKPHIKTGVLFLIIFLFISYLQSFEKYFVLQNDTILHLFLSLLLSSFPFFVFLLLLILFLNQIISGKLDGAIYSISTTLLGIVYIGFPLSTLLLLAGLQYGGFYIFLVTWATSLTDIMSYLFGKVFGKHKVNFLVSPNKTLEGYGGGIVGQVVSTLLIYLLLEKFFFVPYIPLWVLAVFALFIALVGILGDLAESLLKRDAAIKDSGNFLPGHGGVLDRIDSLLFTVPLFYFLLLFLHFMEDLWI